MALGFVLAGTVFANLVVSVPFVSIVLFATIENRVKWVRESLWAGFLLRLAVIALLTYVGYSVDSFLDIYALMASVIIVSLVLIFPYLFAFKVDMRDGQKVRAFQ